MKRIGIVSPCCARFFRDLRKVSKTLVLLLAPVVLLPLILATKRSSEWECAYVVLLMAIYWLSSALPIAITALLPVILFPLMGLMSVKDVARNYITDTSFILLGGLMIALAVERSNFHKRLALRVLLLMGTKPIGILLGVMLPTWFLSMWISNTATTSMMLPIAAAIVKQLGEGLREQRVLDGTTSSASADNQGYQNDEGEVPEVNHRGRCHGDVRDTEEGHEHETCVDIEKVNCRQEPPPEAALTLPHSSGEEPEIKAHDASPETTSKQHLAEEDAAAVATATDDDGIEKELENFEKMLCLGVAYSATVGGTATLTGTPPNLVFAKLANILFEEHGRAAPITFSSWAVFGFPHAIICFALTLAWLHFFFLGVKSCCFCCFGRHGDESGKGVAKAIRVQYDSLGKMSFAEISTLVFFILLIVLWFTRDPGVFPGYSQFFKKGYVSDAVPAMFVAILLFAFPSEKPDVFCLRKSQGRPLGGGGKDSKSGALLPDWESVGSKLAWGPILIMGGGIALAEACRISGLAKLVGEQLVALGVLPPWLMVLVVVAIVAMLTEVTSNTAVITLVTPMLFTMSRNLGLNPLYLTLPATMAASYAFMLPVATPVNALVFADGRVTILDMVKTGFVMNIACVLVVTLGVHSWGRLAFGLDTDFWPHTTTERDLLLNSTDSGFTTSAFGS